MELMIKNLHKQFGNKVILNQINLTVKSGEVVGLIGPNGAGKTTFLKILANVITDYQGKVYFDNQSNKEVAVFQKVSLMQDAAILYPHLSGYDYLIYLRAIYQLDKKQVEETIGLLKLEAFIHQKIATYSLGMKQQLLMAMAIINRPSFLILDEPFNGLDPSRAIGIKQVLKQLNETGMTILLSSHQLSFIEEVTDKVYFLKAGELIPFELQVDSGDKLLITTSQNQALIEVLHSEGVAYQVRENEIIIQPSDIHYVLDIINRLRLKIEDLRFERQNLEAIYQEMYELI